jgi:nuclear migration protein JNM1
MDEAAEVYATPDDATETNTDTSTPEGGSESDTSHEDEDERQGVSRRRLYPGRARSRFDAESRRLDTTGTDLSDRVDGLRQGYKVRKSKRREDEDEEPETLEAKIARLKREIEECKVEAEQEQQVEGEVEVEGEETTSDAIEALSRIMSGLDVLPSTATKKRGHARMGSAYHDAPTIPPSSTEEQQQQQQHAPASAATEQTTLTNITSFDTRLSALETALGLPSLPPTTELSALTSPLLPTIALLDHQIATLTTATSLQALEAASTKIHALKTSAESLTQPQSPTSSAEEEEEKENPLSSEDMETLKSLYTLLPTLQSFSPLVPALTNRLRSLRTLHAAASTAHKDLDGIEARQGEMEKELKMWREGLERVEEAVREAEEQNGKNGRFVKGWVEDLEGRVKGLKR